MKKTILYTFFGLLILTTSAFSVHKFYMAIYQVNYAPQKKMLQITSRIFVDDLNKALEKKYNKKLNLGNEKEAAEDIVLLKKYLAENFSIKVNGQSKPMTFLSKELDGDVLVCYSNIKGIPKINSLEISNSVLIDWNSEQQNITHITVLGIKNSILFTDSSSNGMLKY
jgi:hypothetical protein